MLRPKASASRELPCIFLILNSEKINSFIADSESSSFNQLIKSSSGLSAFNFIEFFTGDLVPASFAGEVSPNFGGIW